MSIDTLELQPELQEPDIFQPTNLVTNVAGVELQVFDMPQKPDRLGKYPERIALSNPDGFQRLMESGVSGLEEDEVVDISRASKSDSFSGRLFRIARTGDTFVLTEVQHDGEPLFVPATEQVELLAIQNGDKRIEDFFNQDLFIMNGNHSFDMAARDDKLGETVRAIGFSSEAKDTPMPMPQALRANISSLQEAGVMVPNIKFFKDGAIQGQDYLESWAAGEFPASEQPTFLGHDLYSEHYKPLIAYREDAMTVASLFAQAVLESDEIVGSVMASEYEINREHPELMDVVLTGQAKIDHAAMCLDHFTTDIEQPIDRLELDAEDESLGLAFTEHPPHGMRHMPQMISTIMNSPQKDAFIAHLDSMGSKSLNRESGEFSYETFMKEIFTRAQKFWGIDPKEPVNAEDISPPMSMIARPGAPKIIA